jgi:hypothetical protein
MICMLIFPLSLAGLQILCPVSGFGGLGVSMLALGTRVHRFESCQSRQIFQGEKIHSMPFFGV